MAQIRLRFSALWEVTGAAQCCLAGFGGTGIWNCLKMPKHGDTVARLVVGVGFRDCLRIQF